MQLDLQLQLLQRRTVVCCCFGTGCFGAGCFGAGCFGSGFRFADGQLSSALAVLTRSKGLDHFGGRGPLAYAPYAQFPAGIPAFGSARGQARRVTTMPAQLTLEWSTVARLPLEHWEAPRGAEKTKSLTRRREV